MNISCLSSRKPLSAHDVNTWTGPARGGIGLGLAEPDLRVQYIVAGGAASDHESFFGVGDELVSVDGTVVQGMRLREVSALIIGEEGTEVEIGIVKALTRERKSIILTRRGAGSKKPAVKKPDPLPPPKRDPETLKPLVLAPTTEKSRTPILVALPTFEPADGHTFPYATTVTHAVSIRCHTPGAQVRYTLDGTLPGGHPAPSGLIYRGGGIQVRQAVTVKAIALVQDGDRWWESNIASASFTFQPPPPSRSPSPPRSPSPAPLPQPEEEEEACDPPQDSKAEVLAVCTPPRSPSPPPPHEPTPTLDHAEEEVVVEVVEEEDKEAPTPEPCVQEQVKEPAPRAAPLPPTLPVAKRQPGAARGVGALLAPKRPTQQSVLATLKVRPVLKKARKGSTGDDGNAASAASMAAAASAAAAAAPAAAKPKPAVPSGLASLGGYGGSSSSSDDD